MTYSEFYRRISDLPTKFQNRDLETYLSALFVLVEQNQNMQPDGEKLLSLLEQAFTSQAIQFDNNWLKISEAPDFPTILTKSSNSKNETYNDRSVAAGFKEIQFTFEVLKFQISELHKMRDKQLGVETRYFGIASETENLWYNFDPFTNLECGAAWLMNRYDNDQEMGISWQTLGEILEAGRIYE